VKRALWVAVGLALLLWPACVRAEESRFGGCTASGKVCLAPAAALSVFQYNLKTGDIAGGVTPAIGYGLTWKTSLVDLGAAVYAGVQFSRERQNTASGQILFSGARYLVFGPGFVMLQQTTGPAVFQATFSVGTGSPVQ
jgi:hypothetical protein